MKTVKPSSWQLKHRYRQSHYAYVSAALSPGPNRMGKVATTAEGVCDCHRYPPQGIFLSKCCKLEFRRFHRLRGIHVDFAIALNVLRSQTHNLTLHVSFASYYIPYSYFLFFRVIFLHRIFRLISIQTHTQSHHFHNPSHNLSRSWSIHLNCRSFLYSIYTLSFLLTRCCFYLTLSIQITIFFFKVKVKFKRLFGITRHVYTNTSSILKLNSR